MQSKKMSAIETLTNTGIGFVISLLTTQLVLPQYHCPVALSSTIEITFIFTVVSIVRGYVVRRLFNWQEYWRTNSEQQPGLLSEQSKDVDTSSG